MVPRTAAVAAEHKGLVLDLPNAIRVTTDRDFFEMHSDSVEFWTPGSPAFPDLAAYRA
jgi:hypothetical protein